MSEQMLLTTIDNPHNPFTEWDEWYAFDTLSGYNTCALLSRVTQTSEDLDDAGVRLGMIEIVTHNLSGKHVLVTMDTFPLLVTQHNKK